MPERKQPNRRAATNQVQTLAPDVIAKRTKRHLDELERSNYSEHSTLGVVFDDDEETAGKSAKGRARAAISDRRTGPSDGKRHKSSMSIRTAVLYRKNFNTLLEESGVANLPSDIPTYITAAAPPPRQLPRLLCSVCGYWGRYKCLRCAAPYCDLSCQGVHDETRCEKRVV